MSLVAYVAIHKETNEMFIGNREQIAFQTKAALKNSMNHKNKNFKGKYIHKDPQWEFFEIDPVSKRLINVSK